MLCEMKDVRFVDPIIIIGAMSNIGQYDAVREFRSTSSIKVDYIDNFRLAYNLSSVDYVSYIKSVVEISKFDVNTGKYNKIIYFIDHVEDLREELNRQEIPYYVVYENGCVGSDIIDEINSTTNEFKFEKFVNLEDDKRAYDFLVSGLMFAQQSDCLNNLVGFGDPSYKALCKFKKVIKKNIYHYDVLKEFDHFVDSYGHFVLRSKDEISDKMLYKMFRKAHIGKHDANYMACAGQDACDDVVVLNHDDALAIIRILNKCLEESGKSDVEAFGNDGISYERLCDIADHVIYPMITNTKMISV